MKKDDLVRVYHLTSRRFPLVTILEENHIIDTGATHSILPNPSRIFSPISNGIFSAMMNALGEGIWENIQQSANHFVPNMHIDGLIGVHILGKYNIYYDVNNQILGLDRSNSLLKGKKITSKTQFGLPVITAYINNQKVCLALDTGADCGFLLKTPPSGYSLCGNIVDHHPLTGEFTTQTWKGNLEIEICNQRHSIQNVRFGKLPQILALSLQMAQIDGVVGVDIFSKFAIQFSHSFQNIEMIDIDIHSDLGMHYDAMFEDIFPHMLASYTDSMIAYIQKHYLRKKILDVGAGTGRLALPLAEQGFLVTAVEPSSSMMGALLSKAYRKNIQLQSYLGEIQDITLPRNDYEVLIFAFGVTDYINDDEKLKQILRHVSKICTADAILLIQPSPQYLMTSISNVGTNYTREIDVNMRGDIADVSHRVFYNKECVINESIEMKYRSKELLISISSDVGWNYQKEEYVDAYPTLIFSRTST